MKPSLDNAWLGVGLGVVTPLVVFLLVIKFFYPVEYLQTFFRNLWLHLVAPGVLSFSVLSNLLYFFPFLYTNRYRSARGVLGATLGYGVLITILKLVT